MLTQEQRDQYGRDGYIVIPGFKSPEEISRLRLRAEEIVDAFDPLESRAVFTTRDQENASDAWFLGSDNTVRDSAGSKASTICSARRRRRASSSAGLKSGMTT